VFSTITIVHEPGAARFLREFPSNLRVPMPRPAAAVQR
jgi:hypothetical protein